MQIRTRDIGPSVSRYAMAQYGGEVFYVDGTDGNDLFDGKSWRRAKATIQAAVNAADPWTTIFIKGGTYAEAVSITTDNIQLIGEHQDLVTVIGAADVISLEEVTGVRISGITLDLTPYSAGAHALAVTACQNCIFREITFDSPQCDVSVHIVNSWRIHMERIYASMTRDSFYLLEHDPGDTGPGILVADNYLVDSDIFGMVEDGVIIGRTIAGMSPEYTIIRGNTFHSGGDGVLLRPGSTNTQVYHNNFLDVTNFIEAQGANAVTQRAYENYYNDTAGDADHDGIRDTAEVMTGITDYAPLSAPSIWEKRTLGLPKPGTLPTTADLEVPTVDSTANVLSRDVDGNKADTANVTPDDESSLMRYVKGALNQLATILTNIAALWTGTKGLNDIHDDLNTHNTALGVVDGYHDVPAANAVTNAQIRDVLGNKADTVVTTASNVASLAAYIKGIMGRFRAETADSVSNTWTQDVLGNKQDTAQTTVSGLRSVVAYVKGLLNALATHAAALAVVAGQVEILEEHVHSKCEVYPTGGAGVSVQTANADDWALGGLVEIMPASTAPNSFELHYIVIEDMSADGVYELVLYAGLGDTEVARIRFVRTAKRDPYEHLPVTMPIQAADQRIRAAVMSDTGNNPGDTIRMSIFYHVYT